MHIYYNNTNFARNTEILIIHDNGEKIVEMTPNNEKNVGQLIDSMLKEYPECRITVHVKNAKILSAEFASSLYENPRLTIKRM